MVAGAGSGLIPMFSIIFLVILVVLLVKKLSSIKTTGSKMNWTKALKTINSILLIVSVIVGFVIGISISVILRLDEFVSFCIGFFGALVFGVAAFVIVAFSMVVVEISENVKIKVHETKKQTELLEKIAANISLDRTLDSYGGDSTVVADRQNFNNIQY